MQDDIVVSYVVTVFNKEPYIGCTVKSLLQQEGKIPSEYIFVDDVSSDRSVEIIREKTANIPNVTIIENTVNEGPSIRLNQGARIARGKYLQFIDSDDILAANATQVMLSLMERHNADMVHGGWERTNIESVKLLGRRVPDNAPYKMSEEPYKFIFSERIRRMSQMVRRNSFMEAGGCDERVFIQDESLGLRLARVIKKIILLEAPVLLIPQVEGELSLNVSQLNHDRFLAHYDMLMDFPDLDETIRHQLYRRCVSSAWKQQRHDKPLLLALATPEFSRYLFSKCKMPMADTNHLQAMKQLFDHIRGVRRVHQ